MQPRKVHADRKTIRDLGGATAVARLVKRSPQCVHNWTVRGIPAAVKVAHPDLFLNRS